jgi:hypothetical protein
MGQYHIVVNWDKKEYINPHEIGLGLKQGEQLGAFNATMGDIIYLLLAISNGRGGGDVPMDGIEHLLGRWAGDRVFVAGDYAEPSDISIEGKPDAYAAYGLVDEGDEWTNISSQINILIRNLWGIEVSGDGWGHREVVDKNAYLAY